MGNDYAWRMADGSNNNVSQPDLGKAGTAYARSVQQPHPLPRHMMPDAGLIFDALLRREKVCKFVLGLGLPKLTPASLYNTPLVSPA